MNTELKDKVQLPSKDKEKKFKPIKIPVKQPIGQPKKDELEVSKISDKQNRIKPIKMQQVSSEDKKLRTREAVCFELLKEGFIQSFIDMFYICHKTLPNLMQNKNYFGETITTADTKEEELSESDLQFLNELGANLRKAQTLSYYHSNDKQQAMNEYNALAFTYEDQGDYVTAAYFYHKVVELAKSSKNKQYEVVAMVGIAKCLDQQKQTDKAIRSYEQALKEASNIKTITERENMIKLISKDLIEIYMKVAEEHEKNSYQNALEYYEKCLQVAKNSKEKDSEGSICYKIGQLYYRAEDYPKSVQYQERYLNLIKHNIEQSKALNDEGKDKTESSMKTKTMEAHASLAKCYLKMKQIKEAEFHLNQYNFLAKQLKIQNALADSSYYLAKLYQQKGNSQKSIDYYRSYFEAAKSERPEKKDRRLVDKARVTYAIAKASENMEKYIKIFNSENSLKEVLDWKIKKELK